MAKPKEINHKIRLAIDSRTEWYRLAGFAINGKKSEVMGFGFTPEAITVDGVVVEPTTEMKFLGLTIKNDLTWGTQVKKLCGRIRAAASRIRAEGSLFTIKDRKTLFTGWILGSVYSNGPAYLSFITKGQKSDFQVAGHGNG